MGLGKTIEMLSLIHTLRAPRETRNPTTLVIAPMSIIAQWKSEADSSSHPGTLKTIIYYGAEKALDLPSLCASPSPPNLIITSYGVLLSEYTSGKPPTGLFGTEWYRIVLDEAQFIKNRLAKTARAAYELQAGRRWVLSGTPIVNKLEDLYSLVHFLGVEPWGVYSYWRTFITVPFESREVLRALDVVQTILEPLVLRRTKDMKDSEGTPSFVLCVCAVELTVGNPIVSLPDKVINKEYLEMSAAEREVTNKSPFLI
jgi:DNA repair protein RAD5